MESIHKAAERTGLELAEQAAFHNSVLEGSTEYSIVAKDLEGRILAWNEGARRVYGYEREIAASLIVLSSSSTPVRLKELPVMLPNDCASITDRAERMERLPRDMYIAAVELNLPQSLIDRLWIELGRGQRPEAFRYDDLPGMVERPAAVETVPRQYAPLAPLAERRTVMIVDDDEMMLDVLRRILSRDNYEIVEATCGEDARAKAAVLPHLHLLVTDCMMPGLNGPQVSAQLRDGFPDLVVLFQTGFSDLLFAECLELADNEAFLEKPFSARGLLEAARLVQFGSIATAGGKGRAK